MRLQLLGILTLLLGTGCGSAEGSSDLVPQEYTLRFRISTPADWGVNRDVGGMRLVASSPRVSPEDTFKENVNVTLEGVPADVSPQQYVEGQMILLQQGFAEMVVLEAADHTLGGRPARRLVYEYTHDGRRLKALTYILVAAERAYVITGTTLPHTFQDYAPTMERIANSFDL